MSAVLSGDWEMNLIESHRCQSTWKIVSIAPDNQLMIKDVDNGGMLATFGFLYPVEPPCATASRKRPPPIRDRLSKTPKISQSKPYGWKLS